MVTMISSTRLLPASSLQSFRTKSSPKGTLVRTRHTCALLRAANQGDFSQQAHQPEAVSRSELPKPRPGGWSDDISKTSTPPHLQASPVQIRLVKNLYKIMQEALSGQPDDRVRQAAFEQQVRLANKANVFKMWPFPDQNGVHNSMVFQQNLSEFLFDAYHAKQLLVAVPMMQILLKVLPACSTAHSPHLLEFLERLAELRKSPDTPRAVSSQLEQMLRRWIPALQQVMADPKIRFDSAALHSNAAFDSSQLQAITPSAADSAAMQRFTATPHVERLGFFPQLKPYLWSPPAEHMAILRGDDLSPTAMDAYELVKSFVPAEIPEELQPTEIWRRHRELLNQIGGGPHGPVAIQNYFKRHSNVFMFDYNARMSERRRLEKENGQAVPPFSAAHVLSVGADMGFTLDSSHEDGTHHADQEDSYL